MLKEGQVDEENGEKEAMENPMSWRRDRINKYMKRY